MESKILSFFTLTVCPLNFSESEAQPWESAFAREDKWPHDWEWGIEAEIGIRYSGNWEGKRKIITLTPSFQGGSQCGQNGHLFSLQWSYFGTIFMEVLFSYLMSISAPFFPGTGSGAGVRCELRGFGDRVFWVRSTQAMCASAAGAGPAVLKSEEFAMDTGSPGSSDAEVRRQENFH